MHRSHRSNNPTERTASHSTTPSPTIDSTSVPSDESSVLGYYNTLSAGRVELAAGNTNRTTSHKDAMGTAIGELYQRSFD